MVVDQLDETQGTRILFTLALGVVLVYGLRLMQPIMLPFLTAAILAITCLPLVLWLERHRVPSSLAIVLTVLLVAGVFTLLIVVASQQVSEVQATYDRYARAMADRWAGWMRAIEEGWPLAAGPRPSLQGLINIENLIPLVGGTFQRAISFLSNTFLVFLILVFALGEAAVFPKKIQAIVGEREGDERFRTIIKEVQVYLGIKTLTSLGTGTVVALWTWALNLDFPILLGLCAFVLNYVPTIGSIISAGPALALAVIQYDFQHMLFVAVGYIVVNMVIGNWMEPILMGRRLGLSTLVVILSLVFWGWLWGPIGALLSVPLTQVIKIMLENTQDLRWVAVMLDKGAPSEPLRPPSGPIVTP